ncbi:NUDIX domain-containing protein [Planococcus shenhongbingii]|uniref:NUDIX domain-containing protein n=1 Tax=Planococcus shenhongbingii TaxID=3058398 RepID=A0ABT8NDV5_9BACL|nr:NUDIX domain-containing protein [Planococcus sp. N017]MDN7246075.1 NUDIX domain-containing protein [Planococcus sp. N017]
MEYIDLNGNLCKLSFEPGIFSVESRHVLVICKYSGKWVLTKHKTRGLEFPGGKVEPRESLAQAAVREVYEETGAVIGKLEWLAEYMVFSDQPFCKTVFIAETERLEAIALMETEGIVLSEQLLLDDSYSFLMKDKGMKEIIKKVMQHGKWDD